MALSEQALVELLQRRARRGAEVVVGIGHDAAVVRAPAGDELVLKSDQTIEEVHFRRGEQPWRLVGRKALARVLSDVGAIGGRPVAALCSLAVPGDVEDAEIHELFDGLLTLADQHGVSLVGGDLSRSPRGVALDVAALGFMEGRRPLLRSGARSGDRLVVTGPLGGSRTGHHLTFEPRWRAGVALAASGAVHASIDLSDGLARDLHQIARASNVGAEIELARLPRRELTAAAGSATPAIQAMQATIDQALHDGEDFELLVAIAPGDVERLRRLPELASVTLIDVGCVVDSARGVTTVDAAGNRAPLATGGFEHRLGR